MIKISLNSELFNPYFSGFSVINFNILLSSESISFNSLEDTILLLIDLIILLKEFICFTLS